MILKSKKTFINYFNIWKLPLSRLVFCPFSLNQAGSTRVAYKVEFLEDKTLKDIGLDHKSINIIKSNQRISSNLLDILQIANISNCDKKKGNLLFNFATKITPTVDQSKEKVTNYILEEKICNPSQLDKALSYLKENTAKKGEIDWRDLESYCGIDKSYTDEELKELVTKFINENASQIKFGSSGKNCQIADIMRKLRGQLPVFNETIFRIFSGRISELEKEFQEAQGPNNAKYADAGNHIWDKLSKLSARDMLIANNSKEQFQEHIERTKGVAYFRFPPEPNGYLHIGHAKAMRVNFHSARVMKGQCYLRYDDTNPEKESAEFINNIKDNIEWLGYTPFKITHASDYFQQIYEYAIALIKKGRAYVCDQSQEEMQKYRQSKLPSPNRDRSQSESLILFEKMKNGEFQESQYCLRLKIDPEHPNPTLRDPVAYRVKYHPHPHTGKKWKIYPTYDFTHCICDSIEDITYSLCTLEFEIRRDLYYWILDALEIYKPVVWEYSRMNVSFNILSKRKLSVLVNERFVKGWDDPRLLSLNGLKRRGYTPSAINDFCDLINCTRRGNENYIDIALLEHTLRKELNTTAPRTMAIIDPVQLTISNVPENFKEILKVPLHPSQPERGHREVEVSKHLYIEREDISENHTDNFFGLIEGRIVALRYFGLVKCSKIIKNQDGTIKEVMVEFLEKLSEANRKKTKGMLHWLSTNESMDCEVRIYNYLFDIEDPAAAEDFKASLSKSSLRVVKDAKIHTHIPINNHLDRFQFERLGYFCVDIDSNLEKRHYVFNKSVSLAEKKKFDCVKFPMNGTTVSQGKEMSQDVTEPSILNSSLTTHQNIYKKVKSNSIHGLDLNHAASKKYAAYPTKTGSQQIQQQNYYSQEVKEKSSNALQQDSQAKDNNTTGATSSIGKQTAGLNLKSQLAEKILSMKSNGVTIGEKKKVDMDKNYNSFNHLSTDATKSLLVTTSTTVMGKTSKETNNSDAQEIQDLKGIPSNNNINSANEKGDSARNPIFYPKNHNPKHFYINLKKKLETDNIWHRRTPSNSISNINIDQLASNRATPNNTIGNPGMTKPPLNSNKKKFASISTMAKTTTDRATTDKQRDYLISSYLALVDIKYINDYKIAQSSFAGFVPNIKYPYCFTNDSPENLERFNKNQEKTNDGISELREVLNKYHNSEDNNSFKMWKEKMASKLKKHKEILKKKDST